MSDHLPEPGQMWGIDDHPRTLVVSCDNGVTRYTCGSPDCEEIHAMPTEQFVRCNPQRIDMVPEVLYEEDYSAPYSFCPVCGWEIEDLPSTGVVPEHRRRWWWWGRCLGSGQPPSVQWDD